MSHLDTNGFESALVYKYVLENMKGGVIAVASDGTIIIINQSACNILLIDEKIQAGDPFTKVFSKLHKDLRNDELNDAILNAVYDSEITHQKVVKFYSGEACKDLLMHSTALVVKENGVSKKIGMILVFNDITEQERLAHVQNIFGKYIDPHIAKRLMDYTENDLMKANRQVATVSFCDMNNFTTLCESLPADVMENLMNAFFTKMSEAIHHHDGVIDKFIGDAIMSFWGFPFTAKDKHFISGCEAALEQIASIGILNAEINALMEDKYGKMHIQANIGIATGELLIANIGSDAHKSITVLGNIVNLASRLVGANKTYGTHILLTEESVKSAGAFFEYREIDTIRVKGKEIQTTIYELLGTQGNYGGKNEEFLEAYAAGLLHYRQRNWEEAIKKFSQCLSIDPNDKACSVFLERIAHFKNNPPDDAWNGVWIFDSK